MNQTSHEQVMLLFERHGLSCLRLLLEKVHEHLSDVALKDP